MGHVLVGVAGGIAAYKACELVRRLVKAGHETVVVPTVAALNFVGAATWEALSGHPVRTGVFEDVYDVPHVRLGQEADLVVIAPATADLLARAASGRADDLLTNVLLTAKCPILMAPAMHTDMWLHPATRANVSTLRQRGVVVMNPADGRLTGSQSGPGRLPEAADIAAVAASILQDPGIAAAAAAQDLAGLSIMVTAGGTREYLDPVRFLGNASSGLMGIALARAAALRGAGVHLVAANVSQPVPAGVQVSQVVSTADMGRLVLEQAAGADVIIMAAAPADYTPASPSVTKLKKSADAGLTLQLKQTVDILASISGARSAGQTIVGFAAETAGSTAELLALGRAKLARKGCDLLVINDVSGGKVFGSEHNSVHIIDHLGMATRIASDKNVVAHRILDVVVANREYRKEES